MKEKEQASIPDLIGKLIKKSFNGELFLGIIRRNPRYFILWVILLLIYIMNHNEAEKEISEIIKYEKRAADLHAEAVELQYLDSREGQISSIVKKVNQKKINLVEPSTPPQKIKFREKIAIKTQN